MKNWLRSLFTNDISDHSIVQYYRVEFGTDCLQAERNGYAITPELAVDRLESMGALPKSYTKN